MTYALTQKGHDVRAAVDGPTAFRAVEEWCPDVALLDIGPPGMSGHAWRVASKRIRAFGTRRWWRSRVGARKSSSAICRLGNRSSPHETDRSGPTRTRARQGRQRVARGGHSRSGRVRTVADPPNQIRREPWPMGFCVRTYRSSRRGSFDVPAIGHESRSLVPAQAG